MTNASKSIVTQRDRVAIAKWPQIDSPIGLLALRESSAIPMSPTARTLFQWVCLNSKRYGCAFPRLGIGNWAKVWKVCLRTVRRAREELERKGLLRHTIIERHGVLPDGELARNRTLLLYPIVPAVNLSQKLDRTRSGSDRTFSVLSEGGSHPFSDLKKIRGLNTRCGDLTMGDPDPDCTGDAMPLDVGESSRLIFERWCARHDPAMLNTDDAIGWYDEMIRTIQGWLGRGIDLQTCLWAVDGAAESPLNKPHRGMRTIPFIFGSRSRIIALSEEGRKYAQKLAKTKPTPMDEGPLDEEFDQLARSMIEDLRKERSRDRQTEESAAE